MNKQAYSLRREHALKALGKDSLAIIPAARECLRSGDTYYTYRQNSNFYYLTGFEEPKAIAVLIPERTEGEFILFNRKHDKEQEIWFGKRAGQEGACADYGAQQAFALDELDKHMPQLLLNRRRIYYHFGQDETFDKQLMGWLNQARHHSRSGMNAPLELIDLGQIVDEMRLIKDATEITTMRQAASISVQAHKRAMQLCHPGMHEYELQAAVEYEFQRQGCRAPAYTSIVGAGKNGCILHYTANRDLLRAGDLVLLDAGGEYQNYTSDITRTFPVDGKFTPPQAAIYDLVLQAQLAGIAAVKPGRPWDSVQQVIVEIITAGLVKLGILKGDVVKLIQQKAYQTVYMHKSGHWLGLDTHDVGQYKVDGNWRELAAGMVLTVEPGIYMNSDYVDVAPEFRDIGVRIEDDVLVTQEGCEVLTAALPKSIAEIEGLMATSYKE